MDGAGDYHQLLVGGPLFALVRGHIGESIFAEIAGMGLLSVNDQYCGTNLIGVGQLGHVDERER